MSYNPLNDWYRAHGDFSGSEKATMIILVILVMALFFTLRFYFNVHPCVYQDDCDMYLSIPGAM